VAALFRFETNQLSVEAAAAVLKRLYWAERELFRAAGSRHGTIVNWETKKALPRHLWEDTLHADALRGRVLELRYPRRDVDREPPEALIGALHEVVKARSDAEMLSAVYRVLKPALITAYECYLAHTDELDDAPSVYHLRRILQEKKAQVAEGLALLGCLSGSEDTSAWEEYLRACLSAAGGMLGDELATPMAAFLGFSDRPGYRRPERLARDPRFEPALIESPWWDIKTPLERQLLVAIEHVNEIWATEVPLLVVWELAEMPWEFYRDVARWAWDECRHTIMGERRLEAWGFTIGVDVPMIDDAYQCVAKESPIALLGLLNAFERQAPPHRKRVKATFEALGDPESAQDVDYDWADEAIHMSYGNRWLEYLVPDEDEREALRERTLEQWNAYLVWAKTQPMGDYEPFEGRIRARMRALEDSA
jgi:uncharacterized ferritin-like protein (DUF455 family)